MASTREERLQMRQRGAGTREIKRVDFGFSFGGPAIGPPEPAPVSKDAEPAVPPQTQPAPTSTPQESQISSQTNSQGNERIRNTPGSVRNKLPQRPSTYDIPSDDGPGEPRSNKRRRINPPQPDPESLPRSDAATNLNNNSASVPNGHSRDTEAPANRASEATTTDAPQTTVADASPQAQSSIQNLSSVQTWTSKNAEANGAEGVDSARPEEQAPSRSRTQESRLKTAAAPDTGDTRPARTRSPNNSSPRDQPTEVTRKKQRKDPPTRQNEHTEQNDDTHISASPKAQRSAKSKAKGARKGRNAIDSPEPDKESTVENAEPSQSQTAEDVATEIENQTRSEHASTKPNGAKPKRPRGRPSLASKAAEAREKGQSDAPAESTNTAGESSATGARRGRKKKAETRPEPEPEQEDEPEEAHEPEPEQGEKAAAPKPRRGRPPKKTKRTTERQPTPTEEQHEPSPAEEQADTENPRQTRRKPREPRGETVPVTVHRLTNASALGAMYADADGSGSEEEESADELTSRQKTKLPNRGGVNPADVLSQICRETLEKTLTTLKNGIANETNPTRRAEWTRKRKAVEAFSSELDGRLLDLSEMLDSNFVLGVQLKKAKREMMDLRSHLYQVRRERESIALQMDAVRAKHMEEENAKTARATINNSLHSLELALDRSQRAPSSTEPPSADLEFMLRTVADDVSSRAPGSQGGLLQQIRAFNAQLESTARRLEGK